MEPNTFVAKRFVARYTHRAEAPAEAVFPLLCPVREREWLRGWAANVVFSESGIAENNCVFQTDPPGRGPLTYTVTRYEPENFRIEFAIFSPGLMVEKLDLALMRTADGNCEVHWTRTYTGLSPQGNAWAESFVSRGFEPKMAEVAGQMNAYLQQTATK